MKQFREYIKKKGRYCSLLH